MKLNAYVGKDSFNAFTPDTPSGRSILLRSLQSARVAPVLWRKSKCSLSKKQCIVTHHIQRKKQLHCLQKESSGKVFMQAFYKRDIRTPENAVIIRPQRTPCLLSKVLSKNAFIHIFQRRRGFSYFALQKILTVNFR